VDSAYRLARVGQSQASGAAALDAYVAFERVERELRVKNPALTAKIEAAFATLRERSTAALSSRDLETMREELARSLDQAEDTLGDRLTPVSLFTQSLVVLLREGLEAILVVGALMAFLVKTGATDRRRDIHWGVGAALLASLLTAVAVETVFRIAPAHQEGLEGITLMVAVVMLFSVSYWLLSKLEVAHWNRFVKSRMTEALGRRSTVALAAVAFLAVYREGVETVLFYKALALSGGAGATWPPIVAGMAVGGAALGVVYLAINRWGVKLPLKPFFGTTSAFLYVMAFVFAGKGVAELQEAGWVALTPVPGAPRWPAFGVYPTAESLGAQAVLLLLATLALVWIFFVSPRRLKVTSSLVPEPGEAAAPNRTRRPPTDRDRNLLRSIERIEADLSEIRAELARMKDGVRGEEGADRSS
jgi:high-affinity iron transporter